MKVRALLLTAAITILAEGCATPQSTTPQPSSAASEIAIGGLAAGRYTNSHFTPRIEVEVPAGWLTYHLSPDFFDVAIETDDGPVAVMFLRPIEFLTSTDGQAVSDPEEAIGMLEKHPGVTVSEARSVEFDGVAGLEVDVAFERDDTHIIRVSQGDIGFGPQTDVRLAYLETDVGLLVIGLNAPAGHMEEAEQLTEDVRASIRIGAEG